MQCSRVCTIFVLSGLSVLQHAAFEILCALAQPWSSWPGHVGDQAISTLTAELPSRLTSSLAQVAEEAACSAEPKVL